MQNINLGVPGVCGDHSVRYPSLRVHRADCQVGHESEFCATDNVEDVESGPELASNIQCVVKSCL